MSLSAEARAGCGQRACHCLAAGGLTLKRRGRRPLAAARPGVVDALVGACRSSSQRRGRVARGAEVSRWKCSVLLARYTTTAIQGGGGHRGRVPPPV